MNIEIKGEEIIVDGEKYVREPKPQEPEIEKGRLVKGVDKKHGVESVHYGEMLQHGNFGYIVGHKTAHVIVSSVEPVHRRVNELTSDQIDEWVDVWEDAETYDALSALKKAYKIITGEDHA